MREPRVPAGYEVLHSDAEGKLVPYHPPQIFYTYFGSDGKVRWRHMVVGGAVLGEGEVEWDEETTQTTFSLMLDGGGQYAFGDMDPLQIRIDPGSTWVTLKPLC